MSYLPYLIVTALGASGFCLAAYIHHKKHHRQRMVCPIGSDCDVVIHSQYSKFLGVQVETLGMFYYGLVTLSYFIFTFFPKFATDTNTLATLIVTSAAFLFSLYLIFIQAFVLRQWCTWCLISATICVTIFLTALSGLKVAVVPLLATLDPFLLGLNAFAIAVGVGTVTIAEIFFMKFLKDHRISEGESEILHTISQVLWMVLAIIILSQIGEYLTIVSSPARSVMKNLILAVIILNGAFLNLIVTPRLIRVSFGESHLHAPGELRRLRKLAFALSGVSLASW